MLYLIDARLTPLDETFSHIWWNILQEFFSCNYWNFIKIFPIFSELFPLPSVLLLGRDNRYSIYYFVWNQVVIFQHISIGGKRKKRIVRISMFWKKFAHSLYSFLVKYLLMLACYFSIFNVIFVFILLFHFWWQALNNEVIPLNIFVSFVMLEVSH